MAEPGGIEIEGPKRGLSWREIFKQGWFDSEPPVEIGKVADPELTKRILGLTEGEFIVRVNTPNLGDIETLKGKGLPVDLVVPVLDQITAYEQSQGHTLENRAASVILAKDAFIDFSLPHSDAIAYDFKVGRALDEALDMTPGNIARYTVAFGRPGTKFFPGRYEMSIDPSRFESPTVRVGLHSDIARAIRNQASQREVVTEELSIQRFTQLDVHSAANRTGALISVSLAPQGMPLKA